jgi:serine/threonine-protein kinase
MGALSEKPLPWSIGRYALHGQIASGGMATVHLGRLVGPGGFGRTVAIKRLHPQYAKDPEFVAMFLDEARLAARVQHPNVVPTIDIVALQGELFVVMEHVQGEALSRLIRTCQRTGRRVPLPVVSAVLSGALNGLHAAHETKDERGKLLDIVHRDVSPQNILVGVDGVARVLDFGVAKAAGRIQTTQEGQLKGKLAYMAPEQLRQNELDRTADLYAAAVVLWETLTLERLFQGDNQAQIVAKVLAARIPPPSEVIRDLPHELDAVTVRGLDRDPAKRFLTGREMASAIESMSDVTSGVETQAKMFLAELASGPHAAVPEEEPRSEMSSVGIASRTHGPPIPRSRRGTWIAVGAVVVAGVALAMNSARHGQSIEAAKENAPLVAATTSAPEAPVASAAEPPSASPSAAGAGASAPNPGAPNTGTPLAAASPPPPVVVRAPPAKRYWSSPGPRPQAVPPSATGVTVPAPASQAAPARTAKDCDPPYTIDSGGEKHYKKECF